MTSHELAKFLLSKEDLPLMIYKESDESSHPMSEPYKMYMGKGWNETIFENEVERFGHSWEDVEPVWEVMIG